MNIRDIASAAHVSVATVSKVINHKDSEISNETRQRVLSVIKEYQYTPYANIQASFQTFHRQTIAFLTEKNSAVSKYVFDIETNVRFFFIFSNFFGGQNRRGVIYCYFAHNLYFN